MEITDVDSLYAYVDSDASRPLLLPRLCFQLFSAASMVLLLGIIFQGGGAESRLLSEASFVALLGAAGSLSFSDSRLTQDPKTICKIQTFLARYTPVDDAALAELQQEVDSKGQFSYEMLRRWHRREKVAILRLAEQQSSPGKRPRKLSRRFSRHSFLSR